MSRTRGSLVRVPRNPWPPARSVPGSDLPLIVPVNDGQAMIYAYHIGYQEQIDSTPDSSQTLLEWVDRKTRPRVAEAFLRRLRVVAVP